MSDPGVRAFLRGFLRDFVHYWSPEQIANRTDQRILAAHAPEMLSVATPQDERPVCMRCTTWKRLVTWPCPPAREATDRIAARQRP